MKKTFFVVIVLSMFVFGYKALAFISPYINYVSPSFGPIGTEVTITGRNFDLTNNRINFAGGVIMNVPSFDTYTISFVIPKERIPLCRYELPFCSIILPDLTPGTYTISVTNSLGTSNLQKFKVTK